MWERVSILRMIEGWWVRWVEMMCLLVGLWVGREVCGRIGTNWRRRTRLRRWRRWRWSGVKWGKCGCRRILGEWWEDFWEERLGWSCLMWWGRCRRRNRRRWDGGRRRWERWRSSLGICIILWESWVKRCWWKLWRCWWWRWVKLIFWWWCRMWVWWRARWDSSSARWDKSWICFRKKLKMLVCMLCLLCLWFCLVVLCCEFLWVKLFLLLVSILRWLCWRSLVVLLRLSFYIFFKCL